MTKADIAREFLSTPEIKELKANGQYNGLKACRLLLKKYPDVFLNVKGARNTMQYVEGKSGDVKRAQAGAVAPEFIDKERRPFNPYKLPESDETEYVPYPLRGFGKVAIMSDIHIPYHSIRAVTKAIEKSKDEKVNALLLNGDVLDFYSISTFDKDPRKRKFSEELDLFAEFLTIFDRELNCPIYFKMGNHEERYDTYLWRKARELVGVPEFNLESLLANRAPKVKMIMDQRIVKVNSLNVLHGHELRRAMTNPISAARRLFLNTYMSALQGDVHTTSYHPTYNALKEVVSENWTTGCLCELYPKYARINKWNHGFAIIHCDEGGVEFEVDNYKISKNGKLNKVQ